MASILSNNYQQQNVFLGGHRNFIDKQFTNGTGSILTIVKGTVMGTILATGYAALQVSNSTDGSEMPRFVAADDYTIPIGATVTITVANGGEVNQTALTLTGVVSSVPDTWATVVRTVSTGGGTIYDLLVQNSDLVLIPSTENSGYDN